MGIGDGTARYTDTTETKRYRRISMDSNLKRYIRSSTFKATNRREVIYGLLGKIPIPQRNKSGRERFMTYGPISIDLLGLIMSDRTVTDGSNSM